MDILGDTLLRIVHRDTKLNAAAFPPAQTADTLWSTYKKIRPLKYTGHPQYEHCDQETQFQFRRSAVFCHTSGKELTLLGVEEHISVAEGEHYHKYLRCICIVLRSDYLSIEKDYAL